MQPNAALKVESNQIKLSILLSNTKSVDIKFSAHQAQQQDVEKPSYLKVFDSNNPKGLNRIVTSNQNIILLIVC